MCVLDAEITYEADEKWGIKAPTFPLMLAETNNREPGPVGSVVWIRGAYTHREPNIIMVFIN